MEISTFALYGIVEAVVLLLVICGFLLVFIKRSNAKNRALQNTFQKLITKHKALRQQLEQERIDHSTSNTYKKQINDQLLVTRAYHKGLDAGQDIALDLNPESPPERQTAAIRHALLVAEKEALNSSTDGTPNWAFLQTKFQQLIQFYVDLNRKSTAKPADPPPAKAAKDGDDNAEQLHDLENQLAEKIKALESIQQDFATAEKRIGNLEKFKKLYFDMEKQWEEARAEAELYYQRLQGLRDQVDDSDGYDNLINDYHNVYSEFELTLQDFSENDESDNDDVPSKPVVLDSPAEDEFEITEQSQVAIKSSEFSTMADSAVEIMNSEKQALEELKKLRNLTADQHRLITRLQQQLDEAKSLEEKEAVIQALQQELKKQMGFVKESEACIQLLENELSNAMRMLKTLETDLAQTNSELQHVPKMQETIHQFAHESKEMLLNLTKLESLNAELRTNQGDADSAADDQALVAKMQAQLQALQSQYAELEERYLEVKMSG